MFRKIMFVLMYHHHRLLDLKTKIIKTSIVSLNLNIKICSGYCNLLVWNGALKTVLIHKPNNFSWFIFVSNNNFYQIRYVFESNIRMLLYFQDYILLKENRKDIAPAKIKYCSFQKNVERFQYFKKPKREEFQ
jgi:hypothetical protein